MNFKRITASRKNFLKFISPSDEELYDLEVIKKISQTRHNYYKKVKIPKKGQGFREILIVNGEVKRIQEKILELLQSIYNDSSAPKYVNGFIKGRSIYDNAIVHTNKKHVINFDIKDFFKSITLEKINTYLSYKPVSLPRNQYPNVLISHLCTYDRCLPQGAPTSPILSNIVLKNFDYAMIMLAKKYGLVYTRYADDLTFSGNDDIDFLSFKNTVAQKLIKHGFEMNMSKARIRYSWQRQLVTGLVVNNKVNIKSEFIATTKSMIHNWEKYGIDLAKVKFNQHRKRTDGIHFENVLRGRIDFIGSILNRCGDYKDPLFTQLNLKYWTLLNCIDYSFISDKNVRIKLFNRNYESEKIAYDSSMYESQEYRFISYCFKVYTQMEIIYKYYFFLKFNGDFMKLGLFMYDNSKNIRRQFKRMFSDCEDENEKIKLAKQRISSIKNLKEISTFNIESLFIDQLYKKRNRSLPKFFNFIREIRNYHAHAGEKIVKQTFEEVRSDVKSIIESRNLGEVTLESKSFKGASHEELKKINQYQFYLWFQSSPFDDVREILKELAYEVKIIENRIRKNAANKKGAKPSGTK